MATHMVAVHDQSFSKKATQYQMGNITNDFKIYTNCDPRPLTITEILDYASKGQHMILADYELIEKKDLFNTKNEADRYTVHFDSTTLIRIDIDDKELLLSPEKFLENEKETCVAVIYTPSHSIEENHYAALYQFDRDITSVDEYTAIVKRLIISLKRKYPNLLIDTNVDKPLQIVRSKNTLHLFNDNLNVQLNSSQFEDAIKVELELSIERSTKQFKGENYAPISYEELKKMALKIGAIPKGEGKYWMWYRICMGIKHHHLCGNITDLQSEELLKIICGDDGDYEDWKNRFNPNGAITIGSFIYFATRVFGYNRDKTSYFQFVQKETPYKDLTIVTFTIDDFIDSKLAFEVLSFQANILFTSPPNTGKTTAFVNAAKELVSTDSEATVIFAMPNILLAQQIATQHSLPCISSSDPYSMHHLEDRDNKILVSTYDHTVKIISTLLLEDPDKDIYVVVDEVHRFVSDYEENYRQKAIFNLNRQLERAISVVYLSGTPHQLNFEKYDQIIEIKLRNAKKYFDTFQVLTVKYQKEVMEYLYQYVFNKVTVQKTRFLIFIESYHNCKLLVELLSDAGVCTSMITAKSTNNPVYTQIVNDSIVPENIDVIIATSKIIDGVSIINNNSNWECVVVSQANISQFFNPAQLVQGTARLRNTYKTFTLFTTECDNDQVLPFQNNTVYQHKLKAAVNYLSALKDTFPKSLMKLAPIFLIEKLHGIYLRNNYQPMGTPQYEFDIDETFLEHLTVEQEKNYYTTCRKAYIACLEKLFNTEATLINLNDATHLACDIDQKIEYIKQQLKKEKSREEIKLDDVLTLEKFTSIQLGDDQMLNEVISVLPSWQASVLYKLYKHLDYQTCYNILAKVTSQKKQEQLFGFLNELFDTIVMFTLKENLSSKIPEHRELIKTIQAIEVLNNHLSSPITKEEKLKLITDLAKASNYKLTKTSLTQTLQTYYTKTESNRVNSKRMYSYQLLSFDYLLNYYTLNIEQLESIVNWFLKLHYDKQQQQNTRAIKQALYTFKLTKI